MVTGFATEPGLGREPRTQRMGYLAHIVLALVAQGLSEAGLSMHREAPIAVALLVLMPHALAWVAHRLFSKGRFKAGELLYRLLSASAPLGYCAALVLFGWQDTVERWTGRATSFLSWPDWSVVLVLLPFLVYEIAAIDAQSRLSAARPERARWRGFQVRMFASGLAPLAVYVLISSLLGLSDSLRVRIEVVGLWGALFVLLMLAVLGLMLPFLLKHTWDMEPVPDGPQRDLLLSVADLARFENPRLFVWKTGNSMANAAIVGLTPRSRVVLFSDSLLAQMGPSELAAVFAHEMGHAFRRHVPIFVVFVLAFVMLGDLLGAHFFPTAPFWAGATLLAVMSVWFLSFGFLSRRFELEADLFSLDLLGEVRSLISALEKVGGRLRDIASWRHFSTKDRVAFLVRAQADPNVGRRLRRDLRRFTWFAVALFLATGALQVTRLVGAYDADQVIADLRLGQDERAYERIEHADGIDPRLRAIVLRAYESRQDPSMAALAARTLAALRRNDVTEAREWIRLGALRGDDEMEMLDALMEDQSGPGAPNEALSGEIRRRLLARASPVQ